ncbi:ThiF family adenylyltransferase [Gilvimarinus agarilyticus]|uniref:HesA/MoeB/ThiF family protein n=1 Tax=Gilvimarinus sp. 2_MG-2023 TaxID=3062666 RepID=UPI001C084DEB|nr:ThiF family adenylyltransferase [Gilvimarinus sp. 2_MG-2023]MBU2886289.1 ThiF family adenylyltransferase [Gilvimarinus agarilyticus]MDO6570975.1 ThiF family adenylyltransferase [Gilvimarinus sp. 2_MG-2023]
MRDLFRTESIANYLRSKGFETLDVTEEHITIQYNIDDVKVGIKGVFSTRFPFELPSFYLINRLGYGQLAHVSWTRNPELAEDDVGSICEGVTISRSVNYEFPELVFEYALESAIRTLTRVLSSDDINRAEVKSEFAGHWRFHCSTNTVRHIASMGAGEKPLKLSVYKLRSNVFSYTTSDPIVNEGYGLQPGKKDKPDHKGLYIPIKTPILPPAPQQCILAWWHDTVLPVLSDDVRLFLADVCKKHTSKYQIFSVILSVTIGKGRLAWVGFNLTYKSRMSYNRKNQPPLFSGASLSGWSVKPFPVQVHNQDYLLPRGGVSGELSTEKILVVGCGSLGGEIARQLGYSGVGQLDLVDFDSFEADNIYRHVLPSTYIGIDKCFALKRHLENQFPYLVVETLNQFKDLREISRVEKLETFLSQYDGVIVATGDVTQERYFNEVVSQLKNKPWVIYAWLEGYGVGGHSVFVNPEGRGCLACLFRDSESGEQSLSNIQNFLSINQDFAVDLSGCGTHFLPYGYTDVIETATLTTRIVEGIYNGSIGTSVRVSWKGNGREAKEAGLKMTGRWKRFKQDRYPIPLVWSECVTCGSSDDL